MAMSKGQAWMTEASEAHVAGGRLVKIGDTVKLLPSSQRKHPTTRYDALQKWLGGDGPFTISAIRLRSDGEYMLYFGGEPGICAKAFE